MRLSTNFTTDELTASQTAIRHDIDNTPTLAAVNNLQALVDHILQPLRTAVGVPVVINSGYRCLELNMRIGGSPTSQHMTGNAADIRIPGMTPLEVAERIHDLGLPYDQLIHEFGSWVHVSYDPQRDRRARLTARRVDGRTEYVTGLV